MGIVAVKGMPMPKSCARCRFKSYTYYECIAAGKRLTSYKMGIDDYKPRWCPLVYIEDDCPGEDKNQ